MACESLTRSQESDAMEIIQLCELKDIYGYAGFYFSDNQYYQFRIAADFRFVKRFKYKKSPEGHGHLFKLLKAKKESGRFLGPFLTISCLTLDQLDSAASKMPPNSMDCSWTLSRLPDIQRHEALLEP
jgi:hypothetical protein